MWLWHPAANSWLYLESSLIFHYFPTNTETEAKEESAAGYSQSVLWHHGVAYPAASAEDSLCKNAQLYTAKRDSLSRYCFFLLA